MTNYTTRDINPRTHHFVSYLVGKEFGIDPAGIFTVSRKRSIIKAKYAYWYLMVKKYDAEWSALERFFEGAPGTDHSTIMHGVKTCEIDMAGDFDYRVSMSRLIGQCSSPVTKCKTLQEIYPNGENSKSWIIHRKNHRHNSYMNPRNKFSMMR